MGIRDVQSKTRDEPRSAAGRRWAPKGELPSHDSGRREVEHGGDDEDDHIHLKVYKGGYLPMESTYGLARIYEVWLPRVYRVGPVS